tara:strand:+ start:767 stop:1609 length:843 start_codon:yes stop_codon:yes gene_type:complete
MKDPNPVNLVALLTEQEHIRTIMCNGMRWYYDSSVPDEDKVFRASMTSGLSKVYPKGEPFYDWIAKYGHWRSIILSKAIVKGNVTHDGIDMVNKGHTIDPQWMEMNIQSQASMGWRMDSSIKAMVMEVRKCMESYFAWHDEHKPICLGSEFTLYHPDHMFAGRTDQLYRIGDDIVLVDNKTGMPHEHHLIQGLGYAYIYNKYYAPEEYKCTKIGVLYLKDSYRKKPTFSFKTIDASPDRYLRYLEYYADEWGVPKIKFGYKPRKVFSLSNIKENDGKSMG